MTRTLSVLAALTALILGFATPADGQTRREKPVEIFQVDASLDCTLTATNGESVWPGNTLRVTYGRDETPILVDGVEDEPNITTVVEFVSTGEVVTVGVLITEWSSIEADLSCTPPPSTTTTTTPPPDTPPPSDCVVVREGDCTTTTVPDEPTTTTTVPDEPTTTTTTPDPCAEEGSCLPDTGAESFVVFATGIALVLAGAIFLMIRYGWDSTTRST